MIGSKPDINLCYCTNIHPSEDWEETFTSLKEYIPSIYSTVRPKLTKIGLRLSNKASTELINSPSKIEEFIKWLHKNKYQVDTINGFPYGDFYQENLKEKVYQPDWSYKERFDYTLTLAKILTTVSKSKSSVISTVPLGFHLIKECDQKRDKAIKNLIDTAFALEKLFKKTGHKVHLALEPEPFCYIETHCDVLNFFNQFLYNNDYISKLGFKLKDIRIIKEYIGICYDTCHFAVTFNDNIKNFIDYKKNQIQVFKIQISSGLEYLGTLEGFLKSIHPLQDPIYLHQTFIKAEDEVYKFLDIENIINSPKLKNSNNLKFRTHFHVPLYANTLKDNLIGHNEHAIEVLKTVSEDNSDFPLIEVETYTFQLIPNSMINESIENNIKKELEWCLNILKLK